MTFKGPMNLMAFGAVLLVAAVATAQPGRPSEILHGLDAEPPRSADVFETLAGSQASITDPVGDQGGWLFSYATSASQAPVASGNTVYLDIPQLVLDMTRGFFFQAASFGDDTHGALDHAPNTTFALYHLAPKQLADVIDPTVPAWADLRSVSIGAPNGPPSDPQIRFSITVRGPHPSTGRAVYNFTTDQGAAAANVTFIRSGSSWSHYIYEGSLGHWSSGPINDITSASIFTESSGKLTLTLDVAGAIPQRLEHKYARPFFNLYLTGGKRITIRYTAIPGIGWQAVVRKLQNGVYVDGKVLPLSVAGKSFSVTFARSDLGGLASPFTWFIASGGAVGFGNDLYYDLFDFAPNDGVVKQP